MVSNKILRLQIINSTKVQTKTQISLFLETPYSSHLSSAMAPMVRTDATTVRWDMKFVTRQNLEPNDQSLEISY